MVTILNKEEEGVVTLLNKEGVGSGNNTLGSPRVPQSKLEACLSGGS